MNKNYQLTVAMGPVPTLVMDLFTRQPFWPNVSWVDGDGLKTYVKNENISQLYERGLREFATAEQSKQIVGHIKNTGDRFVQFVEQLNLENPITQTDTEKFLDHASAFLVQYSEFSELLFEGVYKNASTNENYSESLKIIEQSKNSLREQLNAAMFEPGNQYEKFIDKLAAQTSVSAESLHWYRGGELAAVVDGSLVSAPEIASRQTSFVHEIFSDQPATFYSGENALSFIEEFKNKQSSSTNEETKKVVKGTTAYEVEEIVRGKVCKIEADLGDLDKTNLLMSRMKPGSILVSQQTAPELLPAMKKAAAIITDIGGLLSHAAITSRELKIPCIVGTGNATQAFQNGDEVEVNTTTGTAKVV